MDMTSFIQGSTVKMAVSWHWEGVTNTDDSVMILTQVSQIQMIVLWHWHRCHIYRWQCHVVDTGVTNTDDSVMMLTETSTLQTTLSWHWHRCHKYGWQCHNIGRRQQCRKHCYHIDTGVNNTDECVITLMQMSTALKKVPWHWYKCQ